MGFYCVREGAALRIWGTVAPWIFGMHDIKTHFTIRDAMFFIKI
jgi:hypothetical protein